MTLQEAIKDLQDRIDGEFWPKGVDNCEDMKLGIEAMKIYQELRAYGIMYAAGRLPGETDE